MPVRYFPKQDDLLASYAEISAVEDAITACQRDRAQRREVLSASPETSAEELLALLAADKRPSRVVLVQIKGASQWTPEAYRAHASDLVPPEINREIEAFLATLGEHAPRTDAAPITIAVSLPLTFAP